MSGEDRSKGLGKSCYLLIVIAGVERFAYKGVASNLVTYLTDFVKMSNSSAAKTVNSWTGFTSMLPLLVAPMADSCWDRSSTILASSFLYVVGLVAVTSTALLWSWSPPTGTYSASILFWSLCLISLGQGAYNPSLQAFGADQLDANDEILPCCKEDDQKSDRKTRFFQWWYFGVCTGSLLGVTLMSYIQDTFGWVIGFAIPSIAMAFSTVLFSCGSRIYIYKPDRELDSQPFCSLTQSIKATFSKLISKKIALPDQNAEMEELELQGKPLCHEQLGKKEDLDENIKSETYVLENAKIVLRLLPIWTMLLMFAVIFNQPATFFLKQGTVMKRNIGEHFRIPPATLQSAITLSIILLMPLYDKILIPMTRILTRNEKGISVMQRMGIGMFLSIIAMIIAALVERKRLHISRNIPYSQDTEAMHLSIFWLLPQYILLGISDIFTVVGMQEFFYNEVPVRMRTMGFALYTSVFGVGSFLSAVMISVLEAVSSSGGGQSWFCDDMREARLDKYYLLVTIASTGSLLLYLVLCKFFKSRTDLENSNCK